MTDKSGTADIAETFTPQDAWDELVSKDDRTSPEDYPDHCLITFEELQDYIIRASLQPATPTAKEPNKAIIPFVFNYENYRGEVSMRVVTPISVRFGSTDWHPTPQWLLLAFDHERQGEREFAMADMGSTTTGGDAVASDVQAARTSKVSNLIEQRLIDLRNANDVFRGMDWDKSSDILRNDREIRWLLDLRSELLFPDVAQAWPDRETIAKAIHARRYHMDAKDTASMFSWYAEDPKGSDRSRMAIYAALQDADAVLAALAISSTTRPTPIDHSDEECPNFPGCHCADQCIDGWKHPSPEVSSQERKST